MTRTSIRDGDQLSLIHESYAGQPATVDRAVSQKQPSRPGAARARQRRPRGTGAVVEKGNRWYGQWYVRGRLVKRSLGPMRQPGSRDGLTRTQAEVRLRELMLETDSAPPPVTERVTIAEVGDRRIKQLARSGRKPDTTLANYESEIRIHFSPFFGEKAVDEITADDVEDFVDACFDAEDRFDRGLGALSVKTVRSAPLSGSSSHRPGSVTSVARPRYMPSGVKPRTIHWPAGSGRVRSPPVATSTTCTVKA